MSKTRHTIVTHNGSFHTDDVFAVATLLLMLGEENVDVIRTREPKIVENGDYVVDVGSEYDPAKNRFDHHQKGGAGKRENGIPYASFGLVWKKFGEALSGSLDVAEKVDEHLVQPVDARDNGMDIYDNKVANLRAYTIDDIVFAFRPSWSKEGLSFDDGFKNITGLTIGILRREIARAKGDRKADILIKQAYEEASDKRIVLLKGGTVGERATRTLHQFPEPLFVIMPTPGDKTWKIKNVYVDFVSFSNRKPLPAEWAGKFDDELARITGVSDATFCHNARFMCVAKSKEGALKLAQLAVESEK